MNLENFGTQLFIHLTITGMAKKPMGIDNNNTPFYPEPNVPEFSNSLALIPKLIKLTGKPERIKVRIDPVLRFKDFTGNIYSNLENFEPILASCVKENIKSFVFSFLEKNMHKKVDNRFQSKGLEILPPSTDERKKILIWIQNLEKKYNVRISACCVPGLPESSCIDGNLLEKLHNNNIPVSLKQPRSRPLCGCTESIDIGGWPVKTCPSGCMYCYAAQIARWKHQGEEWGTYLDVKINAPVVLQEELTKLEKRLKRDLNTYFKTRLDFEDVKDCFNQKPFSEKNFFDQSVIIIS